MLPDYLPRHTKQGILSVTLVALHMQELEKALSKHEIIGVKALAQRSKGLGSPSSSGRSSPASRSTGSPSQSQSSRQVAEFKRSIRETEAEAALAQERVQQLKDSRLQLESQKADALQAWHALQQQQADLRTATSETQAKK